MSYAPRATSGYDGSERRACPRIPAAALPYLTARIAGGPPVRLIDLSKRGVQVDTPFHLQPGCTVAIRFLLDGAVATLSGAVVRSTVRVLEGSGAVTYHTSLAFTEELAMCGEEIEEALKADRVQHESRADTADDYTMIVTDGRTGLGSRGGLAAMGYGPSR